MKNKFLGVLTAMALTANAVPFAVFAVDEHENQVRVIVENTTFTPESEYWDDQFWYGTLVDTWITIDEDSTMMSCIVEAIESVGGTQVGAESNYISYINDMGEFDGGFMSGWMGTLNDWFTNEGFGNFTVAEGELEAGDLIRVMYTCAYGDDLGGSWGNNDTTVKALDFEYGTLSPDFDKDTHEYVLTVPSDVDSIFVTPTASNKNYQVRTLADGTEYKRTKRVPVSDGTQIVVECNYEDSKSMNPDGETSAYTINVKKEAAAQDVSELLDGVLEQLSMDVPVPAFGTSGGEWSVLSLARGGYFDKNDAYFSDYYDRIVETVNTTAASMNMNGALHRVKSTENSRLIIALSALGKNADQVGDWNLIAPYNDFNWIKKQGINGPVFALIALDTNDYQTADSTIRQQCIDYILDKQTPDGGWALSGSSADPDMTAMTIQALARYTDDSDVKAALDKAVNALSSLQTETGGYASWGSVNAESIAQVIVACTALGINPDTDARFIKNGNSAVDALLSFYNSDNRTFSHIAGDGGNGMATDQAAYALVSYNRLMNGQTSLYDMSDVEFEAVSPVKFGGASISLSGNIGVNFYMTLDESVINDKNAYMQFELPNGEVSRVYVSDAKETVVDNTTYYVFSCEVAAKEMADSINAQMFSGSGSAVGSKYDYSVEEYADELVNGDYTSEAKELVEAMTNYGDYAEAYFSGKNSAATSDMNKVTEKVLSAYEIKENGDLPEGIEYYGSSLVLESNTSVRHYFKAAKGAKTDSYAFSEKDGCYYKEITDIPAGKLDEVQNVTIGDYTISYSPMSYAYAVLKSDSADENLKNLVKALYLYEKAADAYKN
ncbi:MAG: cadherin-like beta sandwich domain-containing protein [Alistipes sp.]|nr:cadherin-like beta sandwich domain-containing protein [Alistipes sp.]